MKSGPRVIFLDNIIVHGLGCVALFTKVPCNTFHKLIVVILPERMQRSQSYKQTIIL